MRRTNETLQRIDDTGWCRCLDADFDELETIRSEFEAVAAVRAAVRGMGEVLGGFVYCFMLVRGHARLVQSSRHGEMTAEAVAWEGSGLSEGGEVCAGVAGDTGSPDRHPSLPRASPGTTSSQPSSSHPIPPLHAPSQPTLAHLSQDRYPFREPNS